MKYFLTTFCLILFCSTALAVPATEQGLKNSDSAVYMHDIKLFKQLEDDYFKRCFVQVAPNGHNNICPEGSYQEQVLGTYFRNKLGN